MKKMEKKKPEIGNRVGMLCDPAVPATLLPGALD